MRRCVCMCGRVRRRCRRGLSAWCRVNGYSPRATVYRRLDRIRAEGARIEHSRRPKSSPSATPEDVREEVIAQRHQLESIAGGDSGDEVIAARLELLAEQEGWAGKGWVVPARSTIHKRSGRV